MKFLLTTLEVEVMGNSTAYKKLFFMTDLSIKLGHSDIVFATVSLPHCWDVADNLLFSFWMQQMRVQESV